VNRCHAQGVIVFLIFSIIALLLSLNREALGVVFSDV